jgi:RimJ/RimL family protein N-acetyltransferase
MTVRRAVVDDIEAMAAIMDTVAAEGLIGTEPPVDVDAVRRRFRDTITGPGPAAMWVFELDGRVLGLAGLHETGAAGVLAFGTAILAEGRGRGGGRALLAATVDHARAWGAHKVELEVWPDNARAIALYSRVGFTVEGVRRNHYRRRDGSLRSTVLMAIAIEDGGASDAT